LEYRVTKEIYSIYNSFSSFGPPLDRLIMYKFNDFHAYF